MDHAEMDHSGHDHSMAAPPQSGDYIDITSWGTFHGSNHNSEHDELVGGRTAITTEALVAYNGLRAFAGLEAVEIEAVGEWAFAQGLTNNSQAWGNDTKGVGLWYAMQGAKVGWIADEAYDPQILADIQRTARLGSESDVMAMVREFGHEGFADYIQQSSLQDAFINTLKMEPHYGGWMHGRTHGFLDVEGVAIAHDINHLTVLGWDQNQPFMNDTFDWPQWPALDVSDQTVINYYQGIVALGDPLSQNLENLTGGGVVTPEPQPVPFPGPLVPEEGPAEIDPVVGAPVDVEVSGDLWWGGFTASLTVTNQSDQTLDDWALSFTSAHRFYGEAWGVEVVTEQLSGDLYRYQLSGADWGQSIGAGESRTVGFNALAGTDLARNGTLSEDTLLAAGTDFTVL
jgi:endoglucanase